MNKKGIIYKATSPSGKSYIGQSTDKLKNRIRKHNNDAKRFTYAFANAIRKYGIENFKWEVIERNIPAKLLNSKEAYYIKKFNTYNDGYNSTEGGDFNPMLYEENRNKISIKKKGVKSNIDQRGEKNHMAVLNWELVRKIRDEYVKENATHYSLAKKYKISRRTCGNVINNINWVDDNYIPPKKNKRDKLSFEIAEKIRNEYSTGNVTYFELADKYGICFQSIGLIIKNKVWKKQK